MISREDDTPAPDERLNLLKSSRQLCGVSWPEATMYDRDAMFTTLSLSVRHLRSDREQPCGACAARFVPSEDSGSRVFSIKAPEQDAFSAIMCGGCYSKWSHGTTMTVRGGTAA